jgi:hypothetical protein
MNPYVPMITILLSVAVAAQQPAAPKAPAAPTAPTAPAPPAPPAPAVDPELGGQPVNIRLDVTVTDHTSTGVAQPKALMVLLVDRAIGRTRAAFEDRSIAVDARPTIVDNRIRVYLTIQSEGPRRFGPPPQDLDQTLDWRNAVSLLLENGKPITALETSDAATKRKMSIEVKATIQK